MSAQHIAKRDTAPGTRYLIASNGAAGTARHRRPGAAKGGEVFGPQPMAVGANKFALGHLFSDGLIAPPRIDEFRYCGKFVTWVDVVKVHADGREVAATVGAGSVLVLVNKGPLASYRPSRLRHLQLGDLLFELDDVAVTEAAEAVAALLGEAIEYG